MLLKDLFESEKMKGADPCWKGYQMVGTKDKDGKEVPNCVPEDQQLVPDNYEHTDDHEVHMAKSALLQIMKDSNKLHDIIASVSEKEGLEGWVQSKITLAADYLHSVRRSLEYDEYEETLHGDEFYEKYGDVEETLEEAEYQGRKVTLNKPMRSSDGPKKFHVFVKDPSTGNVKKVNFGDPDMRIKKSNPERRKSFRARHKCDTAKDKTTARYWSCRAW